MTEEGTLEPSRPIGKREDAISFPPSPSLITASSSAKASIATAEALEGRAAAAASLFLVVTRGFGFAVVRCGGASLAAAAADAPDVGKDDGEGIPAMRRAARDRQIAPVEFVWKDLK